jgi:hypothetical protein
MMIASRHLYPSMTKYVRVLDLKVTHLFLSLSLGSLIDQGHSTQKKTLELIEKTTSPNSVEPDQELTNITNPKISEVITTIGSSDVQPYVLSSIGMRSLCFAYKASLLFC